MSFASEIFIASETGIYYPGESLPQYHLRMAKSQAISNISKEKLNRRRVYFSWNYLNMAPVRMNATFYDLC